MTAQINTSDRIRKITFLGIMSALVIVLQLLGNFIKLGTFSISLVLVPIVLGAVIAGAYGGAWLGTVFGITVLIAGDAALFLGINPVGTVVTVIAKGLLAGLAAAIVYKAVAPKKPYLAVFLAAVTCPVVNTGVFILGCYAFFFDAISAWAVTEGVSAAVYIFLGLAGINFVTEFIINIVLCPVIMRLISVVKNSYGKRRKLS
ncbi:MAG: ECF transporter S component [Clostridia bacterium]|nr:ECF transporter S component [Clostridia bacterium]